MNYFINQAPQLPANAAPAVEAPAAAPVALANAANGAGLLHAIDPAVALINAAALPAPEARITITLLAPGGGILSPLQGDVVLNTNGYDVHVVHVAPEVEVTGGGQLILPEAAGE